MTLLLEGNDAQAQKMMDQFKFTGDTPALYYAQAAWAFKHDNPDQGNNWINSARKDLFARAQQCFRRHLLRSRLVETCARNCAADGRARAG